MGAVFTTPAVLLRSVNYGDADRVVTLLGRNTGRLAALARGARKSTRRFGGGLGLGASGEVALRERPGAELLWLESFTVVEPRLGLGTDVARAGHAGYALELCDRLCATRQPEPGVHDWLDEFLSRLEAHGARVERLRAFELGLLRRLGIGPSLGACAGCGRQDLGAEAARWQPQRGGVVCRSCTRQGAPLGAEARRALERFGRMSLAEGESVRLPKQLNVDCRRAILDLIAVHIPGTLKSVEFIEKLGGLS